MATGEVGPDRWTFREQTALELIDHVRAEDFDVAVSYRMPVDHGFVQMWEAVLGDFKSIPILPIFVNAAAPPVPTYRRARQLGEIRRPLRDAFRQAGAVCRVGRPLARSSAAVDQGCAAWNFARA